VIAVGGGTAIAISLPKDSVGRKQIEKNAVRAPEIRKKAVGSGEVKNDKLTGVDIDESTLGQVPNAAALEGLASSEFLRSNRATLQGPVSLDDPAGGDATTSTLMTVGPVTFDAVCSDNGMQREAEIRANSSGAGGRLSVIRQDAGNHVMVEGFQDDLAAGAGTSFLATSNLASPSARAAVFTVTQPSTGSYRAGIASVAVNVDGDCTFSLTGFG
jgi:hypothetical protein